MSIIAIVAYGCNIDFTEDPPNYGTLLRRTIFQMYFRGKYFFATTGFLIFIETETDDCTLFLADDCNPDGWGNMDFTAIQNLDLMTAETVNIWMWVIASLSLIWLFSSVTLITSKKLRSVLLLLQKIETSFNSSQSLNFWKPFLS